jgi:hypothetical protein
MDCWSDEVAGLENCTITGTVGTEGWVEVGEGGVAAIMLCRSEDIFPAGGTGGAVAAA